MRVKNALGLCATVGIFTVCIAVLPAWGQAKPVAVVGATLIDGSGRAPVADAVVIVRDGRFQSVGKRGDVQVPQDAEVIDAKGKSILPGLIDGHCKSDPVTLRRPICGHNRIRARIQQICVLAGGINGP